MRNDLTLDALVAHLHTNCGDLLNACQAVGISLQFVQQWKKDDKAVAEALKEAEYVGTQGLVSAAIQRGVHGVEEDVYYKGVVVGQKINYSDSLLQTLLKAKVDDFRPDKDGSGTTVNVNVANVMPRASSYEQWLEMKNHTLNPVSDVAKAAAYLMAPPENSEAIEAEFAPVLQEPAFAGIEL